jgi:hypothetical protein
MNSLKQYSMVLFSVLLLGLVGTGCGSGSDSDGPLTKAEFIEQGDALCKKVDDQKKKDTKAFATETGLLSGKPLSAADEKRFILTIAMPPIQAEAEELRALEPPDEPAVKSILSELEKAVKASEENARKGKASDTFAQVAKQAEEYGFKACFIYY